MLKVGIGQFEDIDTYDATKNSLERAKSSLEGHYPKAGMVFAGQDYDHSLMLAIIQNEFPGLSIIGCTTAGELTSDFGFSDDSVIILLFASDDIEFTIGLGEDTSNDSLLIAEKAISSAKKKLVLEEKLCIVFTDSFLISANLIIDHLNKNLSKHCKLFGGISARPFGSDYTLKLFYNGNVYTNATVILLFAGPVQYAYSVSNTWKLIGRRGEVTKSDGKNIFEIDRMKALDFYHYYLGEFSFPAPEFPLAVFEKKSDQFYLRVPGGYNEENGSILFAGEIPEGAEIQLTEASREYILGDLEESSKISLQEANNFLPVISFAFSCIMRKHILGTQVEREIEILRRTIPENIPIFGFYTFGEIAPFIGENNSHLHNCTMINLLIGSTTNHKIGHELLVKQAISVNLDSTNEITSELKKEVRFLNRKLTREKNYRENLENVKDFHSSILKTVNTEIEAAKEMILKKNLELETLYKALSLEKKKSDDLLLNILPIGIAEQLKVNGSVSPEYFDSASILFTDFKDFTKIANHLEPEELLKELDYYFSNFDRIAETFGLEKLKTIGDAYMCASGLPEKRPDHALAIVRAAWEIQNFMTSDKLQRITENRRIWELRIGINSGSLVAGVIGKKKFTYDIWGDAVNIASRLESNSEPGRINISEDTYLLVKDHFVCEPRGKIQAKNRGEIEMYFILKPKG